jgi:hypothetical protein
VLKLAMRLFSLLQLFGLMFLFGGFGRGLFAFFTFILTFTHDASLRLVDLSTAL